MRGREDGLQGKGMHDFIKCHTTWWSRLFNPLQVNVFSNSKGLFVLQKKRKGKNSHASPLCIKKNRHPLIK